MWIYDLRPLSVLIRLVEPSWPPGQIHSYFEVCAYYVEHQSRVSGILEIVDIRTGNLGVIIIVIKSFCLLLICEYCLSSKRYDPTCINI